MAPSITAVEPNRLEKHVRLLAETYAPRDSAHPQNMARVADYILAEFAAAGGRVEEQKYEAGKNVFRNIIARYGPEDGERVIVGAHYDAEGPKPGADDNASAAAGLIELAYLLSKASLNKPVELVAYCLEEPPHFATPMMGSAIHANSLKEKGVKVRAMLCLEMIGFFSEQPNSQEYPAPLLRLFYPSKGNFIGVVGKLGQREIVATVKNAMQKASALPVCSINAPSFLPGIDYSDHRNYWAAGYQAVMITDTAFYRDPNYHAVTDTPDTLDYHRMAQVVEGVHAAVLSLAGEKPR